METIVHAGIGKGGGKGYYLFHFSFELRKRCYIRGTGSQRKYIEEVYVEEVPTGSLPTLLFVNDSKAQEGLVSVGSGEVESV